MGTEEARIYSAVLITSIVLGSIFFFFFISIIRQQRRNMELQKENNTAEITAMEKERQRIAEDLHDEIAPFLTSVKYKVGDFEMDKINDREEVESNLDEILNRIREISFDLMPTALLRNGLVSGIKELVSRITRHSKIEMAIVADDTLNIPEIIAINLFRVVQEVLHNAVKHSQATEILIVLEMVNEKLTLKIADNGVGFNYDQQLKQSNGFGLRSLKNRIGLMGGNIFVKSSSTEGTSYVFEVIMPTTI